MNYQQLKEFCNLLTNEQLQQEVYFCKVDDCSIKVERALITEEDEYFDHTDSLGTLEIIKEENPGDWEDIILDASMTPKGTVLLVDE